MEVLPSRGVEEFVLQIFRYSFCFSSIFFLLVTDTPPIGSAKPFCSPSLRILRGGSQATPQSPLDPFQFSFWPFGLWLELLVRDRLFFAVPLRSTSFFFCSQFTQSRLLVLGRAKESSLKRLAAWTLPASLEQASPLVEKRSVCYIRPAKETPGIDWHDGPLLR